MAVVAVALGQSLCLFVFVFHLAKYIIVLSSSWSIWFRRVSVMSGVRNGHRKSVWISMITGITTAPPIKVEVPLLGHYLFCRTQDCFFFVIMWDE